MPFRSSKHGKDSILVDTWITNLKEPAPLPMAVKQDGPAPPDAPSSAPSDSELAAPSVEIGFSRQTTARTTQPEPTTTDRPPSASYDAADRATLLRKFTVHATSSRRLQGLADASMMLLALLPTVLLRFIRTAMGLLGITEHRWRGISMVLPLSLEDRTQLELAVRNLVAGRLGRRPEPPRRGPVPPAQQLLFDTHAILAAAASTAAAFSLPYDGMPEAALQAKLASYLRGVASADSVCPQDCLKAMRKLARKALTHLCAAAPPQPAPAASASLSPASSSPTAAAIVLGALRSPHSSSSSTTFIARPKKRTVAKAFMAACLLEQSRSQPETLIQLVARLPDGAGDLVETMSLVPLAPGAEYLRLLDAAGGEPGRYAEQLEAATEFGRLRPSDAKKDPAMQGLAINARVHGVGVVRYTALEAANGAGGFAAAAAQPATLPNQSPDWQARWANGGGESSLRFRRELQQQQEEEEEASAAGGSRQQGERGNGEEEVQEVGPGVGEDGAAGAGRGRAVSGRGRSAAAVAEATANGARVNGGGGQALGQANGGNEGDEDMRGRSSSEGGCSVSSEGEGGDTEGLLRRVRKHHATSSQPDLTDPKLATSNITAHNTPSNSKKSGLLAATASTIRKAAAAAAAAAATAAAANGDGPAGAATTTTTTTTTAVTTANPRPPQQQKHLRAKPPSFTAASGPSTCIPLYPTSALDVFQAIYACPRSGAFAVHGRPPRGVGLSRLQAAYAACHALPAAGQAALLGRLGYGNLEELRREVETRKDLCVAQALPVIIASLRLMCGSPACLRAASRTGSFLHVQQSLLSDLHRHERGYLEDTKGALDALADRLCVRFVEGSEKVLPLAVSGSSGPITVSLPSDCVSESALAQAGLSRSAFCGGTYSLTALLFNQGINSLQSLGFIVWGWGSGGQPEPLQDTLNRHSLERLNEYAVRAGASGGPALEALNRHYGPEGTRPPKDTAMFGLVLRACSEVGGGRAVNCKSGKDRTALEVSKALAAEVVGAGLLPAGQQGWLEGQFLRGLSYVSTSQNHGQPPAYAFNEMEIATLPPGWRPDWRLCGKVSS